jgi:hypothetical protein
MKTRIAITACPLLVLLFIPTATGRQIIEPGPRNVMVKSEQAITESEDFFTSELQEAILLLNKDPELHDHIVSWNETFVPTIIIEMNSAGDFGYEFLGNPQGRVMFIPISSSQPLPADGSAKRCAVFCAITHQAR